MSLNLGYAVKFTVFFSLIDRAKGVKTANGYIYLTTNQITSTKPTKLEKEGLVLCTR